MAAPDAIDTSGPDLLELDSEGVKPRALARLGLLTLGVGGGVFLLSLLLAMIPAGAAIDIAVFVTWLAVVVLGVAAGGLLVAAALLAAVAAVQARS
jgi:hypothetical protein